jgi:hypothetical protein
MRTYVKIGRPGAAAARPKQAGPGEKRASAKALTPPFNAQIAGAPAASPKPARFRLLFRLLLLLELLKLAALLLELALLVLNLLLRLLLLGFLILHLVADRKAADAAQRTADRRTRSWRTDRRSDERAGTCAEYRTDTGGFLASRKRLSRAPNGSANHCHQGDRQQRAF